MESTSISIEKRQLFPLNYLFAKFHRPFKNNLKAPKQRDRGEKSHIVGGQKLRKISVNIESK
jgi:hypothetical protein